MALAPANLMEDRYENLLHIEDPDQCIYRVLRLRRFMHMFSTSHLTLVRPRKWDDPFENFLLSARGRLAATGEPVSLEPLERKYYGQCWTYNNETDAMWRIYAPRKDGVKIRTTIRRLFDAVYGRAGRYAPISVFVTAVQYLEEGSIAAAMSNDSLCNSLLFDSSGRGHVENLSVKRMAFEHEAEVRLVYGSATERKRDTCWFRVNPFELFDEVIFDPRMPNDAYEKNARWLRSLGYEREVRHSTLYRIPNWEIELR